MASSLNGTGVTFNDGTTLQSGNIPAANLGSGTANANTVLRGNRTFGAPPAPTTAQVLTAYAGASPGAVGTYTVAFFTSLTAGSSVNAGTTIAGSSITRSKSSRHVVGQLTGTVDAGVESAGFTGTWRLMAAIRNPFSTTQFLGAFFLRIS